MSAIALTFLQVLVAQRSAAQRTAGWSNGADADAFVASNEQCAAGVDGGPQIATRTGQQWGGLNATGGLSDNLILRPPGLAALIVESS
jgi:hypothetical protein